MGKSYPLEIRERVVAYVEAGHTHRAAARVYSTSVSFVNNMVKLKKQTGSLHPRKQGNPGVGKLSPYEDWVRERIEKKGDLTLDALSLELAQVHGVTVHRASIGALLRRLGLSHKKRRWLHGNKNISKSKRTGLPG